MSNNLNNFPKPQFSDKIILNDNTIQDIINKVVIEVKKLEEDHISLLNILGTANSNPKQAKEEFKYEFIYRKDTFLEYIKKSKECKEKLEKSPNYKKYDFLTHISNKAIEILDKIMTVQSHINLLISNFDLKNEINIIVETNKELLKNSSEQIKKDKESIDTASTTIKAMVETNKDLLKNSSEQITKGKESIDTASNTIKAMAESHRTEILGIVTLVFTAFTFIQINFITFSKAMQLENVWNIMFILCSLNISLILSTYVIYAIIRQVTIGYSKDKFCWKLKSRLIVPVVCLIIGAIFSLTKLPKGDLVLKKDFTTVTSKSAELEKQLNKLKTDYENLYLQNQNMNIELIKLETILNESSRNK